MEILRFSPFPERVIISGSPNAILINSRPAKKSTNSILLHFRELEGKPAELSLESKIAGRSIKRMVVVNAVGKEIGTPVQSVKLNAFEVKFVEVQF